MSVSTHRCAFQATAQAPRPAARALRANRSGAVCVSCEVKEGSRVRVASPVRVYHVGKFKQGLDLEGMEGVVIADVRQYNGMQLSATHPYKVQLEAKDGDGKAVKVIAHLEEHEVEEIA